MPKTITLAQSFAEAISINNLNYIMLKRRDKNEMPPLSFKKVFCIFAMLDKMLGGDGLSPEKSKFWKADETTDEELRKKYASQVPHDEILDEIIVSTNPISEERLEKWTIVVFSETFFSDDPWDDVDVEKVKKCCRLLTSKHERLIISTNFLHKYEGASNTPSICEPPANEYIRSGEKAKLLQNRNSNLRFSNCSFIFWNNAAISCYRKTTYKEEDDNLVKAGYGYDFGDWKSYQTPELAEASDNHKEFAELFNSSEKQIIASRTCSDMNHTPNLLQHVRLLILTANGSPEITYWINKIGNAILCVCDADRGNFMVISGRVKCTVQKQVSAFIQNELQCVVTEC
ncbi:hypothetical protein FACS189472_09280 [Alphaproteobacteria bacterium]|nr:hypothetical protein FACS189472_09280 [Alphaproteobacteria bacterium]